MKKYSTVTIVEYRVYGETKGIFVKVPQVIVYFELERVWNANET